MTHIRRCKAESKSCKALFQHGILEDLIICEELRISYESILDVLAFFEAAAPFYQVNIKLYIKISLLRRNKHIQLSY